MQEVMLIKNGELAMKGLNRSTFEVALVKNLQHALKRLGEFTIRRAQSTIYIEPKSDNVDWDTACERVSKVFGLAAFARARLCEKQMDAILENTAAYLADALTDASTFKVEAKRADKTFPLTSPQICAKTGEYLLEKFPHLSVDVHNPDFTVMIEIRDFGAYIHAPQTAGAGGMPVGTGGKAAVLISGGIDSPWPPG